ncbi:hypothetical protein [Gottfriedia acidiceleris]|uniref:hypothetical protein n=1 Tax=Gottfriedia acidiceleris TaxID=371036 RepID=UPI002FFF6B04
MKKLITEIKELNVEIKVALTMFLGGMFSMPIQYLRGMIGIGTTVVNIIIIMILMFTVFKKFRGIKEHMIRPMLGRTSMC